jgi:hypothetical protein
VETHFEFLVILLAAEKTILKDIKQRKYKNETVDTDINICFLIQIFKGRGRNFQRLVNSLSKDLLEGKSVHTGSNKLPTKKEKKD